MAGSIRHIAVESHTKRINFETMKIPIFGLLLFVLLGISYVSNANEISDVSTKNFNSYQKMISSRRLNEAAVLWKNMTADGFDSSAPAALDFTFFSNVQNDAETLSKTLSENYTVTVSPAAQGGYWLIRGTTRPNGKKFSYEQFLKWVEFMIFAGFSNNCVFSTWAVYEPKSGKTWSTETIEVD